MANIFISYRRDDSIATAGRIRDRLVLEFGRRRVFVDVDDIPHGQDFVKVLKGKVAECKVLLAIIGPHWLGAQDEAGRQRLSDPADFVGIEIGSALARDDITLIPVLVDGARMPRGDQLPEKLAGLTLRNGIELRNTQFGSDAERLIRAIKLATGESSRRWSRAVAALLAVGVLGASTYMAWPSIERTIKGNPAARLSPSAPLPNAGKPNPGEPAKRDAAMPSQPADRATQVGEAITRMRAALGPAEGRVTVGYKGGNRVKLGNQVVFEVSTQVPGRLLLIDINAASEVTQIFPNSYVKDSLVARIGPERTVTVPGPGYGFSGFQAVEPVGRGRLLAIVQPEGVTADRLVMVAEQVAKGFEPVNAPGAYLDQLVGHIRDSIGSDARGKAPLGAWGFAISEYEIVR